VNQPSNPPDMQRWRYLVGEQKRLLKEMAAPATHPCDGHFSNAYYLLKEAVTAAMISLFEEHRPPSGQEDAP